MKIAMVMKNDLPLAKRALRSVKYLAEELRKLGHEVWMFEPEEETSMEEIFERTKFDLIHVHHPFLLGSAAAVSRRYDIPLVFTCYAGCEEYIRQLSVSKGRVGHQWLEKCIRRAGVHWLVGYLRRWTKECDLIIVPSGELQRYMTERGLTEPEKLQVIPAGLPEEAYLADEKRSRRIRKAFVGEKKYLICTAVHPEEQNSDFLIDAMAALKNRLGNRFVLLFIGGDGRIESCLNRAETLSIKENIAFAGEVPCELVKDYLFASDVFVSSSDLGSGSVIEEAMAADIPVVATDTWGVREIVKNGFNGYLTPEDTDVFAEKLWRLFYDGGRYWRLKEGASMTAERYHLSAVAKMVEAEYSSLCRKSVSKYYIPERGMVMKASLGGKG